jgi:Holliday junction resolvasome RuvABC endonuclease subunit
MWRCALKVLGVDASTVNIGWALMEYEAESLERHGLISFDPAKEPFYKRLMLGPKMLFADIPIDVSEISFMAIEHSFFTKNPHTGKQISMMIGAIIHRAMNLGLEFTRELSPTEIKRAFAHAGRADKEAVRSSVLFEFGADVSEDEADAIATAQAFIILRKGGVFERREDAKKEQRWLAAQKSAKKKAAKDKKNIKGELPLY